MDAVFGATATAQPEEEVVATKKSSVDNEKKEVLRAALKEVINEDPDYMSKVNRLSGSIKVLNTLGAGKAGNIVLDKSQPAEPGKRNLKPTSAICGYRLQNIGEETISYITEVWSKDETGKWVGQEVEKQMAPGDVIDLTRPYMTRFCSQPEIAFILANGKIVGGVRKKTGGVKEELGAYYFAFAKDENGVAPAVNDDEVKLSVDDENGVVKGEFEETFGYLNNPKTSKTRGRGKGTDDKFTTQHFTAAYVQRMLEESGMK